MEAQYFPDGILLFTHNYQPKAGSLKRGTPRDDLLLPPTKRIRTCIGEDSNQDHHYQELPRDLPEVPTPVVDVNTQAKHEAGQDGESQYQQHDVSSEQPIAQQHQPEQAGEKPNAHLQDVKEQPDAGCQDYEAVKSQLRENSKAERKKRQQARSRLRRANKKILKQTQRLIQKVQDGDVTGRQLSTLRSKIEHQNKELHTANSQLETLKVQLSEKDQKLREEQKAREESQAQAKNLEGELESERSRCKNVESQLEQSKRNCAMAEDQLRQQQPAGGQPEDQHMKDCDETDALYGSVIAKANEIFQELSGKLKGQDECLSELCASANGQIQILRETLQAQDEEYKRRISSLQKELKDEQDEHEQSKKTHAESLDHFVRKLIDSEGTNNEALGRKAREISQLNTKCKRFAQANDDLEGSYEEMEKAFNKAEQERDAATAKLKAVDAVISKRQYDRVMSGNGSRRKPKKEARSVKNASRTGHSNSLVLGRNSITKSRKKPAQSVATARLCKPVVTRDLHELVNASNNFDELIQCAEAFGLKGGNNSGAEVDETEDDEQEDEDSEDEEAEDKDDNADFEEHLLQVLAAPADEMPEDSDAEEEAPETDEMISGDEHPDNDPDASVPDVETEEATQSDDDLEELNDADFSLEEVSTATANSFY